MADYAYFYNGDDRLYNADSMSEWLRKFFTTGVFVGDCQVTSNNNMTVTAASGYANVGGKVKFFEAETLSIDTADATYDRIDNVVVERNDTERDFFFKVIKGTTSAQPEAPELERANGIYQLCIAQVYVAAGTVRLTQAEITDTRAITDLCGYVASTVKELDFTQMQAQFDAYFANYQQLIAQAYAGMQQYVENLEGLSDEEYQKLVGEFDAYFADQQAYFDTWFDSMKGQLSTDAAGNLQNEIDDLTKEVFERYYALLKNEETTVAEESDTVTKVATKNEEAEISTVITEETDAKTVVVTEITPKTGIIAYTKTTTVEETDDAHTKVTSTYATKAKI